MIFTNTISLILALAPATIFAAPAYARESVVGGIAKRSLSASTVKALTDGVCDVSKAVLPIAPSPLPVPESNIYLSHVAIGRGTQNYTCASSLESDVPKANGAIATLYNATCSAVRAPAVLADVTALALTYAIPSSDIADHMLSGHHEFNSESKPFFKLQTETVDFGYMQAALNASTPAPKVEGRDDVPWLKLTGTKGDYAAVYRVNTAGGTAPATCKGVNGSFTIEYAAEYWFYKEA
ncbi:hypothetical protein BS50DRAFT_671272 [Corynespora cassiicola Philippines]|uniref:Malate dehydrogenase n=1 Tax=Corynespora cassiicola Philippines TaxID=1448308 RepID=A0A2T2PBT4_CORCC|nr:hypothetical protein BS50DRAFT_671272 [Corynespora cassiicola Philippines]